MREIKFRAWGHQENDDYRMFYGVALNSWTIPQWEDIPICDHELMQFTGLKDKSGQEIYEGDVLSDGKKSAPMKSGLYKHYIEHLSGLAVGFYLDGDDSFFLSERLNPSGQCDYEVIGNIYENPELLNKNP